MCARALISRHTTTMCAASAVSASVSPAAAGASPPERNARHRRASSRSSRDSARASPFVSMSEWETAPCSRRCRMHEPSSVHERSSAGSPCPAPPPRLFRVLALALTHAGNLSGKTGLPERCAAATAAPPSPRSSVPNAPPRRLPPLPTNTACSGCQGYGHVGCQGSAGCRHCFFSLPRAITRGDEGVAFARGASVCGGGAARGDVRAMARCGLHARAHLAPLAPSRPTPHPAHASSVLPTV